MFPSQLLESPESWESQASTPPPKRADFTLTPKWVRAPRSGARVSHVESLSTEHIYLEVLDSGNPEASVPHLAAGNQSQGFVCVGQGL